MDHSSTCVVPPVMGAITAAIQWQVFTRDSAMKMTFGKHLQELRLHLIITSSIALVVAVTLVILHNSLEVFGPSAAAFWASWLVVVHLHVWHYVKTVPRDAQDESEASTLPVD